MQQALEHFVILFRLTMRMLIYGINQVQFFIAFSEFLGHRIEVVFISVFVRYACGQIIHRFGQLVDVHRCVLLAEMVDHHCQPTQLADIGVA